ncbi:MAG: hypothetical protein ABFS23_08305 [Pseudomonadota bacterium]
MGALRIYAILFLAGWGLWLFMDKSPQQSAYPGRAGPVFQHAPPAARGPAPRAGNGETGTLQQFQQAANLAKAGYWRQAFIFLWPKESWILAGVGLLLYLSLIGPLIVWVQRRRRNWPGRSG